MRRLTEVPPSPADTGSPVSARLARACVRHHRIVLLLWLLLLGAGLAAVGPVVDRLDRQPWSVAPHESVRGNRLLDGVRSFEGQIDAVVAGVPVADPRFQRELAAAKRDLSAVPGVIAVTAPTTLAAPSTPSDSAVSADGRAALVSVRLGRGLPDGVRQKA
ncbi:hypothetical protein ABT234_19350 [Streptomyces sp. NPDC001586]